MRTHKTIILLLLLLLYLHSQGQNVLYPLERKLYKSNLTTIDSVKTLNLLARQLTYTNTIQALNYSNIALELSTKNYDSIGIAYAYRNLSGIYLMDGNYSISMEYLQRSLDIFNVKNDIAGIANCYITLGHAYKELQIREKEIEFHKKSFEIFSKLNDKERIGVSAHNLGEGYYNIGDLAESRKLTLYAIKINNSIDNKSVLSSCFKVMGLIELAENNLTLAENYFKKVLDISVQLGENSQKIATVESMIQLAKIYNIKGNLDSQFKFLKAAADFSKEKNLPSYLQRTYLELIILSSDKNDYKAIKDYVYSYRTVNDTLFKRQLQNRSHLSESIIQIHELNKENAQLEKTNQSQIELIKDRNNILLIISIFTLLFLFLLLYLIKLNKSLKLKKETIELQKKELEILNNTKDKFFSIVAHDLKTPLNSLKEFSILIIDYLDKLDKNKLIAMSKDLKISVDNTIIMTDNLITWASIQMKTHKQNQSIVSIKDIALNIYSVYKDIAFKKNIDFNLTVDDSVYVIGDKNQIEFIVRNLVNNAIKYTHMDGSVSISAKTLPSGKVQISVSDNGIGISNEIQKELFTIGNKQSIKGTSGEKGTGLGLLLCYEFIKLNGGEINFESHLGKGTIFNIIFKSAE
ncbi:tetratricopeptide repeat-containing sensor histidine kinase [Lutibacter sp.]|uniref:tetratricopeptide repeat-containing sensor histidine kinase n=1 Tax=Lutibacter sp. TaxID=1925666 RepID=UPI00273259A0|nr:tetratricopeptide repeat-containing sensor histidine kinase [Lutibacter sp.]MDP3312544.1 tetratricopeptide repeat-containing sensor histidine kinase [Lutibacter sp.]